MDRARKLKKLWNMVTMIPIVVGALFKNSQEPREDTVNKQKVRETSRI